MDDRDSAEAAGGVKKASPTQFGRRVALVHVFDVSAAAPTV